MDKTLDEYHEMNRRNESRKRGRGGRGSRVGRGGRGRGGRYTKGFRGNRATGGIRKPSYNQDTRKRLHISNLSRAFQNADLRKMFEEFGTLKRCGIHFDQMGNSKGTADIEYENHESADKAITKLNKAEINGIIVTVEYCNNGIKGKKPITRRQTGPRKIIQRTQAKRKSFDENPRRRGMRRITRRTTANNHYEKESKREGRSTRQRGFRKTLGRRRRN